MAKSVIITCAVTGSIHTPTMSEHLPITPNEIETDARGEITKIYVKNNDSVEFGQALFGIRRDG